MNCHRFSCLTLIHLVAPPHLRTLTGSDQRQGCRVPGQGRPQHPHSAPHHAGVGQVLQPAGGRLLPPPVGRFHHVLRRLHHRGCHRGRAAHGRREFKGSVDVNRTEPGLSAPRSHRWVSTRHRNGTRHEFDGRVSVHVWGLLLGAVDRPLPPAPLGILGSAVFNAGSERSVEPQHRD